MTSTTPLEAPREPVERWSDQDLERELTLATLAAARRDRFEELLRERRRREAGRGPIHH